MIWTVGAEIRQARPGEARDLIPCYQWLFAPPGSVPPSWEPDRASAALEQAIAETDSAVLVAEAGGRIVGICTAYLELNSVRFGARCWVEDLAVDPEHRSRGIGKGLLDEAKSWARERGATHLELDSAMTRNDAHRFYERENPSWRSICFAWEL